jgi:hypothetical protein
MSMHSNFNTSFVPKDNISRTFGKQTISVYLDIEPAMSHAKKSYAFMVTNKPGLEATSIPMDQKLQILASITRTGALVQVLQAKFLAIANKGITTVGNFTILSYHGRNGVTIPATLPGGNLRPMGNVPAQRRQAGIMYAKLVCDLHFTEADAENTMAHPFSYFVCLPNTDQPVLSSMNINSNLIPFMVQMTGPPLVISQPWTLS